jgi:hypothetical protein
LVDVNGDKKLDILSGSYSCSADDGNPSYCGLFYVLRGTGRGRFDRPEPLRDRHGKPLAAPRGAVPSDDVINRDAMCTRPTAVDLDADGKLDIVAGTYTGGFAWFRGLGKGIFSPTATWLEQEGGSQLRVGHHADPCFVDWDGDTDLDLVSGDANGGVHLSLNSGSPQQPRFGPFTTIVAMPEIGSERRFGDAWLAGPQQSTRVFVDDIDGDGKFDLLVGDSLFLFELAPRVDEATARRQTAVFHQAVEELQKHPGRREGAAEDEYIAYTEAFQQAEKEYARYVRTEHVGFVWLFRQK